jgi:CMP-2-keto-3-deoxyoctulosonic acid synthetase
LEQLRVLAWGFKIRMVTTPHDSIGVDVLEDAKTVEAIIREQGE